jgi:hypothetical protein
MRSTFVEDMPGAFTQDVPPSITAAPELIDAVRASTLGIETLLASFPLKAGDMAGSLRWCTELRSWREGIWLAQGHLAAAGFAVPSWELEFEQDPAFFVETWRAYLAKVWPLVDPRNHAVVAHHGALQ